MFSEADEVAVDVGVRILERVAHAGLRREVDRRARACSRANSASHRRRGRRGRAARSESPAAPPAARAALPSASTIVVVVEVVEADDLVAALEQPLRDVEADEAGRAGDEEFHEGLSV